MELELTEDQVLFHETTVRFIENKLPVVATRDLHDDPVGYDRSWLRESAELGWFTMLVAEDDGGGSVSGAGLVDATLIAEELGRHVQPGPFVAMNVAASAISAVGTTEQKRDLLGGVMAGEIVIAWAFAAADGSWDDGAGLVATRTPAGFTLSGVRGFVQDVPGADTLLVAATVDDRPAQFLVAADSVGIASTPLTCLDLSRRMSHLTFHDVTVGADARLGDGSSDDAQLDHQLQVAIALTVAETIGAMDALMTMTVDYSKDRIAFGRPIGSFQALKHIMADEAMNLEACKAVAVALARAVDRRTDDAAEVTSMAAAYVGDVSDHLAQMALQIHGGIGYTWEHDLHLLMRRIRSNASLYGPPGWHRERVCAFHGLGNRAGGVDGTEQGAPA